MENRLRTPLKIQINLRKYDQLQRKTLKKKIIPDPQNLLAKKKDPKKKNSLFPRRKNQPDPPPPRLQKPFLRYQIRQTKVRSDKKMRSPLHKKTFFGFEILQRKTAKKTKKSRKFTTLY